MPDDVADRLALPPMVARNEDPRGTAYTVSVDARAGISTGISAADRAHTLRLLADPSTELRRPGAARARVPAAGARRGSAAASGSHRGGRRPVPLAGLEPVGVIAELVHDDGSMMRAAGRPGAGRRARPAGHHHRPADRLATAPRPRRAGGARPGCPLPTACSTWSATATWSTGAEHVALVSPLGHAATGAAGARCTPSASPATSSARSVATAGPSSSGRWPGSLPRAASWSTCADTRAGAWGCSTSSRPTSCRTAASTPSTPRSSSACRWTLVSTPQAQPFSPTSASRRSGC